MVSLEVDQLIWVSHGVNYWKIRRFAYFNEKGECCCWYGSEENTSFTNEHDDIRVWNTYSITDPSNGEITTLSINHEVWHT